MIALKTAVCCAAALSLTGCAAVRDGTPSVREVAVAVPIACKPPLGPTPTFPDTDAALRAAPRLFARVQLLVAGRLLRSARLRELGAALDACAAPSTVNPELPHG